MGREDGRRNWKSDEQGVGGMAEFGKKVVGGRRLEGATGSFSEEGPAPPAATPGRGQGEGLGRTAPGVRAQVGMAEH